MLNCHQRVKRMHIFAWAQHGAVRGIVAFYTENGYPWFAANAVETSMELGQHMVQCTLESLEKIIV